MFWRREEPGHQQSYLLFRPGLLRSPHVKGYTNQLDLSGTPGLRPIGLSPGSWQTSLGLGSMSRYSAQILICFIAYIFQLFYSSVGLVGNFAGLPVCTVPSAIVHCNQNEAGHQTIKAPNMPCWGAAGPSKHSLASMPQTGKIDR